MTLEQDDFSRLKWRSSRGMLELDLLLKPFVDARLKSLSLPLAVQYEKLLEHPDPDIFNWLMGYGVAPLEVKEIVAVISQFHRFQN